MNYEKCSAKSLKKKTIRYELIGCPFCGREDTVNLSDCSECFSCVDEPPCDCCDWKKYLIACNVNIGGCGAASGLYDTKEEAIEAWNSRVNNDKA